MKLRRFQTGFLRAALAPGVDTAALSIPRGNGKSFLAGLVAARTMTPTDPLFVPGTESVIAAASLEQGRIVFRFARQILEARGGYRFLDSNTRIGVTHKETNTRLRVIGSNGRTAMGLVQCPIVIADEPGSWETNGGTLLFDAIQTAQGKPGSPLRAIYIGTIAPSDSGWWKELVEGGSKPGTHVQLLQGRAKLWDDLREIRRVNPLSAIDRKFWNKLKSEREEARKDSRLKSRFLSYRLNLPSADEATLLLEQAEWDRACERRVPPCEGRPVVGIDLGFGRAWSAATAIWRTGRIETLAVAPGLPDLREQERRDQAPRGAYERLRDLGQLTVADNLHVQPVPLVVEAIREKWGTPIRIVGDYFRKDELRDATAGFCPVIPRRTRWSESAEDIRATRKHMSDGPFVPAKDCREILAYSLSRAMVKPEHGTMKMEKRGTNNEARDDVAASFVMAAGAWQREFERAKAEFFLVAA